MSNAFVTESLAGTGKTYVQGQMTTENYSGLHFQVWAPGVEGGNRQYGLAFNTELTPLATRALEAARQRALSMANTRKEYAVVRIKPIDGGIHIQVAGEEVNRTYGAAFNVEAPELVVDAIRSLR